MLHFVELVARLRRPTAAELTEIGRLKQDLGEARLQNVDLAARLVREGHRADHATDALIVFRCELRAEHRAMTAELGQLRTENASLRERVVDLNDETAETKAEVPA